MSTAWSMPSTLQAPSRGASGGAAGWGLIRASRQLMRVPTYRRRRWGRVPGMAGAMLALVVMFDRAQMIHSGTHRGAASAADPVMSAPLARVHAALVGLLDGCTCLAVGWRAGGRPP